MKRSAIRTLSLLLLAAASSAAQSSIPTPASILGFPAGADFKLANYDESMRYFEALARSTDHTLAREVRG